MPLPVVGNIRAARLPLRLFLCRMMALDPERGLAIVTVERI